MPIEPTEPATHTGTDRRAFLTRSAAGGALVATAAATGLTALGANAASAQESPAPTVEQEFAAKAAPLELAASVAYSVALTGDAVVGDLSRTLRQFQRNHQEAAALLTSRIHPDAPPPLADQALAAQYSPGPGSDEAAVASLLAALEEGLAATHLASISTFEDTSFAKTVSQVLATEEQQAVVLGRAGGASIESLTPATASTDGTLEAGQPAPAAGDTEGEGDDAEGSGSEDSGNATDSGNETDTGGDDTDVDAPAAEDADADSGTGSADDSTN